jgi:hypothetical protein
MTNEERLDPPLDSEDSIDDSAAWDGYLGPRLWFPVGLIGVALIAVLGVMLALNWGNGNGGSANPPAQPGTSLRSPVHWHADFALVIRGEHYDFNQPQFVATHDYDPNPAIHVHDPRHSVVHVHLTLSTWGQFFESLDFRLADECITLPDGEELCSNDQETLKFIVNGVAIDRLRFQYVGDLDRLLIHYGPETLEEVLEQWEDLVSDEACIPSAICSDRFPPGGIEEEPCAIGSGAVCS